jgi:uncharacterized protein YdeI (YjbR/CyaY-like superfamily)
VAKILPRFFATPGDWHRWLENHHASERELWVGFYKKGSGRPSITWPESVDEALCFGWIDGVRKTIDGDSYVIRFTPRRAGSIWSDVNTRRAGELIREKRMHDAGVQAFKKRDPKKSGVYSFEQRKNAKLSADYEREFKRNSAAWIFFQAQPPGYRKVAAFYVMSAKREETRARRLEALIRDSAAGRRIGLLRRPGE